MSELTGNEIQTATHAVNERLGYYGVIGSGVIETGLAAALPLIEQRLHKRWTEEMEERLCGDVGPDGLSCDLPANHVAHRRAGSGKAWFVDQAPAEQDTPKGDGQ